MDISSEMDDRYLEEILRESNDNLEQAKEYLDSYLLVTYPEISELIVTKRVSYTVLQYQIDFIK